MPKEIEPTDEVAAPPIEEAPAPAASRRTFRVDARHAPPARPPVPEPEAVEPQEESPGESFVSERDSSDGASRFERDERRHDRPAPVEEEYSAAEQHENASQESYDEDDQGDFGNQARPDLRGMSKKQRRKILAELREKERANRQR